MGARSLIAAAVALLAVTSTPDASKPVAVEIVMSRDASLEQRRTVALILYKTGVVDEVEQREPGRFLVRLVRPGDFIAAEFVRRSVATCPGVYTAAALTSYLPGRHRGTCGFEG